MWPGRDPTGREGWQYEEDRGPPAWPPQLVPRHEAPLQAPIPVRPGLAPAWEPQDFDPRYPESQQPFQSTSAHPAHPQHQYSYPPVHTTNYQQRNSGSSHFHPYLPPAQSRPLLFINTVPPAPASAAQPFSPEVISQLKPKRKRITPVQLEALTSLFDRTDSPSFDLRESLGMRLGMSNREVQVWFQNRRAKMNRLKTQSTAPAPEHASRPKSSPPHPNAFASSEPYSHRDDPSRVNPHQRPRTEPWSSPPASPTVADATMQGQLSSFRLPMAPPPVPQSRNSAAATEATSTRDRPPPLLTEPPPPPPSRRVFSGQIDLPGRSPNLPSSYVPVSPYRPSDYPFFTSPSFSVPSQIGAPPSPSASSLGWPSPAFSSSGSSLFSTNNNTDPLLSPYTPSSISSPSGTFFRLNLSPNLSPGVGGSPRCDSDAFPSSTLAGRTNSPTPSLDPASLIRLPPIVPAAVKSPRETAGVHKRSRSDSGPRTKLPPIQGLVDSIGLKRSPNFASSAPNSPADVPRALPTLERHSPPPPLPPSPYAQPRLSPGYGASRAQSIQRRSHHRPSSLSNILPRTEEEPALRRASRDGDGPDEPLGLGMLAVASELVEEGDGRQVMFDRARRMSYDVAGNRDTES